MVLEAVLLDMDGTIIDLEKRWVEPLLSMVREVKPDFDIKNVEDHLDEIILKAGGKSKRLVFNTLWTVTKIAKLTLFERLKLFKKMFSQKEVFRTVELIDGADDLIEYLKSSKYKIGIVTTAGEKTMDSFFERYPEFDFIEVVITRQSVHHTKPDPEGVKKACKLLGVSSKKTALIGDLPTDIQAIHRAGGIAIAVLGKYGNYTKGFLDRKNPDYLVKDLFEVISLLKTLENN